MDTSGEMIDYGLIPDIYSDGIMTVENLGDCFRAVYFTYGRSDLNGTTSQRIVVARIVRPKKSLLRPIGGGISTWLELQDQPRDRRLLNG